jgi:phage-related minor tail protein
VTDDEITAQVAAIVARLDDVDTSLESLRDQIGASMEMWEAANERRRREIEALRGTLNRQEDDLRYELDRIRRELDSRLRRW